VKAKVTQENVHWTLEEDAKLNSAVTNTRKEKPGEEFEIDWAAVVTLVPDQTKEQCRRRWHRNLNRSIDRASKRTGKWPVEEYIKLKGAVQTYGGKNWDAIAALVPGRGRYQCYSRWRRVLNRSIDRTSERTGKWPAEEDIKLKDAVQTHGGKNWDAIAALVPGRVASQCWHRWHD
jgi:hypothetical protein